MKKSNLRNLLLGLVSGILFLSSCEIGLGPSVDTEVPQLEITSPGVDAVIRDKFAIKGTFKDDGEISRVSVSLKRTDGRSVGKSTVDGSVDKSGTWSCVIDPSADGLMDGSYEATVTIYDSVDHKTTQSRTFSIDNTPPLVVLQRPSTKLADASFDTYGQKFTLEGQAADDNSIDHIDVEVYSDNTFTTLLKTITLNNVPPTIEMDVAKFVYHEENDYSTIYGQTEKYDPNPAVERFCKIRAYDDAQRYPVDGEQSAADKLGNCTSDYYLYSDISGSILTSYKITEVYHILNGTFINNVSRNATPSDVKTLLTQNAIQKSQFKLNPENSPSFVVSGRSALESGRYLTEAEYQVTSGNICLEVEISPGLDKTSLVKDTLGLYLQKCDATGKLTRADDSYYGTPIWLVRPLLKKDGTAFLKEDGTELSAAEVAARNAMITPSGTSYKLKSDTISTTNFNSLEIGENYRIIAVGYDYGTDGHNGNEVYTSTVYGMQLISTANFIELALATEPEFVTSDSSSINAENKTVKVKLTYSGDGPFYIHRNGDTNSLNSNPGDSTGKYEDSGISTLDPNNSSVIQNDGNGNYYISYQIKGTNNAVSNTKSITLKYDNTKPVILNPVSTDSNYETDKLEYPSVSDTEVSSFRFKGKASDGSGVNDSGVAKVYLQIIDNADSTKRTPDAGIEAVGTGNWYLDVKTTDSKYTDVLSTEGKKTVKIWAYDIVGLKSDVVTNTEWMYDKSNPSGTIASFKTIDSTTGEGAVANYSNETTITSNFSIGKIFSLKGSATDSNEVANVKVTQKVGANTAREIYNQNFSGNKTETWEVLALPRPDTSAAATVASALPSSGITKYTYEITITDVAGKTYSRSINVTVDKDVPTITLTSPAANSFGESALSGNETVFRGEAKDPGDDATGVVKLCYAIDENATTSGSTVWTDVAAADGAWNISKTLGAGKDITEGKHYIHIKSVDGAGNESSVIDRDFMVDLSKPTSTYKVERYDSAADKWTEETALMADGSIKVTSGTKFRISGTASDVNGIKAVTLKDGDTAKTVTLTDATGAWVSDPFTTEKTYDFTIIIEDKSGKIDAANSINIDGKKTTLSKAVVFDVTAPVNTIDNLNSTKDAASKYWIKGTGSAYLSGTAKDNESGVASRTISVDGGAAVNLPTSNNWTYELALAGLSENTPDADSNHAVTVVVTDNVGHSTTTTGYFRYDKAIPTANLSASVDYINASKSVTIAGRAYDSAVTGNYRPVESAVLSATKDGVAVDLNGAAAGNDITLTLGTTEDNTYGSFTQSFNGSDLSEGTYVFTLTAKDYAGQGPSQTPTARVIVDKTAPTASTATVVTDVAYTDSNSVKWYSNNGQIKFKVSGFTETGSGIASVEGKAFDSGATADMTSGTSTFIKKTDGAGNMYYEGTVSAAVQGANDIYFLLEDNAENKNTIKLSTIYIDTESPDSATIMVDGVDNYSGSKLVNGKTNLDVYITVADKNSAVTDKSTGIKSVNLKSINGTSQSHTAAGVLMTSGTYAGKWKISISKDDFESGNVVFEITDNAGNTPFAYQAFSLQLDKTFPSTSISIYPNDVNKTVTIGGTASDDQTLSSVILQYRKSGVAAWTDLAVSGTYSWSTTIDTTTLTDGATYEFRAVATDAAGNVGNSGEVRNAADTNAYSAATGPNRNLTVDQDSDRPVIKFTNLTFGSMGNATPSACSTRTLLGIVTDDDGIADGTSSLWYQVGDVDAAGWNAVNVSNGAFTITLDSDGSKKVYFKVTDGASTPRTFTSAKITNSPSVYSMDTPRITDGTNLYAYKSGTTGLVNYDSGLCLKVDTQPPVVKKPEFAFVDDSGNAIENPATGLIWSEAISSTTFGGTKKKMKIRQYACDDNGISTTVGDNFITVEGSSPAVKVDFTKTASGKTFAGDSNTYEEWTSDVIDVSAAGWESGTNTGIITISDGAMTKTTTVLITVDNTPPEVSIISPSGPAATTTSTVYASVVARGTTEADAVLSYAISLDGTNSPSTVAGKTNTKWSGYEVNDAGNITPKNNQALISSATVRNYEELSGTGLSWAIYFDDGVTDLSKVHDQQLRNYLTEYKVTNDLDSFNDIVYLYLWIKAVDPVGNKKEYCFPICLDPQGDRPTISIEYPETAGASLGGSIKLYGSADDNEVVDSAWIQLLSDSHNETPYNGNITYAHSFAATTAGSTYGTWTTDASGNITAFNVTSRDLDFWASLVQFDGVYLMRWTPGSGQTEADRPKWIAGSGTLATLKDGTVANYSDYAIKANFSGSTWSLKNVNSKGEFTKVVDNGGIKTVSADPSEMAMRVYAWDGKFISFARTRTFKIDSQKPFISKVQLKQFSNNTVGTGTVTAVKNVSSSSIPSVKGKWWLTFTAEDGDAVKDVQINSGSIASYIFTDETYATVSAANAKQRFVKYPLGTDSGVGALELSLKVTDVTDKDTVEEYTIRYDNNAPRIAESNHGSYGIKPKVQQSNGFYTLKSFVSDAETGKTPSGVDSVAFYFLRRNKDGSTAVVFDPMQKRAAGTNVKTAAVMGAAGAGDVVYSEGLYWTKATVSSVSESTITLSGVPAATVHGGGICKIKGNNYKIVSISGNNITLDSEPDSDSVAYFAIANVVNNTVAEFAQGDKAADGYYENPGNDDGDRMIELMDGTSTDVTWEAQIVSKNMTDGPVEIHYVAFDKAGNYSVGIVGNKAWSDYSSYTTADVTEAKTLKAAAGSAVNRMNTFVYSYKESDKAYISNNAPRIVSVSVGTDFDGAGTIGDYEGEKITKYYSAMDGKPTDGTSNYIVSTVVDQSNAKNGYGILRLKDYSEIQPEIIGGNGQLYYESYISTPVATVAGGNTTYSNAYKTPSEISAADGWVKDSVLANNRLEKADAVAGTYISGTEAYDEFTNLNGYVLDTLKSKGKISYSASTLQAAGNSTVEHPTWFSFRIWDSTEGTTAFEDSQYATLQVALANRTNDDTGPQVSIDPLYWNSQSDNSLYESSYKNGHVDSSAVLTGPTMSDVKNANVYEKAKVSGIISFRGTALDDHRLGEIWAKFGNATAGYVAPTNCGSAGTGEYDGYYKVASLSGGNWTCAESNDVKYTSSSDNPWNFKILSTTFTEDGQLVSWQLDLDTSALSSGYADDVQLLVRAKDAAAFNSKTGLDPANYNEGAVEKDVIPGYKKYSAASFNVPYYTFNVVPYINGVKDANGNEAKRSRLGRYPVQAGAKITVTGFNFGASAPSVYRSKSKTAGTDTGRSDEGTTIQIPATDVTNASTSSFDIVVPDYSGYIHAVWGTVSTPNNTNHDSTTGKEYPHNISEGFDGSDTTTYGKTAADKNGKNFWNDDVYLSVWNVKTSFKGSINPHSGVIKKVTENNSDGGKIYTKETGSAGVDPVSSMDNTYFGALTSDDLRLYTYDLDSKSENDIDKRYTFGTNNTDIFRVPADAVDFTIVKGIPYYVVQDNWVGNVDANCWGPGLFFARAGWKWNKTDLNSDGTPANESNYHIIIEKQGNSGTARGRNSSTGYDYVLSQFKNPRIAGWNKESAELAYDNNGSSFASSTDYIYISYYDSYARCLKYAAYRAGHRINQNGKLDEVGGQWGSATGKSNGEGADLSKEMRMADNMTGGKAVVAGFDTLNDNPSQFKEEAGEWSDIMIVGTKNNSPRPVIVYYNKTKKCIEVAYGLSEFPTHNGNVITRDSAYDSGTDNTSSAWKKSTDITPNKNIDFGRYLSAAMDKDENIHIAAQDATNNKLYYMFLKKSGNSYSVDTSKTVIVDGETGTGRWTDIELTNSAGNTPETCKPVISYLNTSYLGTNYGVKVAYAENFDSDGKPIFEAMTDPSKWQAVDQRTSVLVSVKENKSDLTSSKVAVGFNSSMLALDFLRDEQ